MLKRLLVNCTFVSHCSHQYKCGTKFILHDYMLIVCLRVGKHDRYRDMPVVSFIIEELMYYLRYCVKWCKCRCLLIVKHIPYTEWICYERIC